MDKLSKIIKITLILSVSVFLVFLIGRIIFSDYYPKSMSRIYYTDELAGYYRERGTISPKTQNIREPYDDEHAGNFIASNLIFEPDAKNLQVCIKYNDSALKNIAAFYSLDSVEGRADLFTYKLSVYKGDDQPPVATYPTSYTAYDSVWFYNYDKLVFDGVDMTGATKIEVEIYLTGDDTAFGSIVVFENNELHSAVSDYRLSSSERLK